MAKHIVHVPESLLRSRQLKTSGQWLTETKVHEGQNSRRLFTFKSPVSVGYVTSDVLSQQSLRCRTSTELFALFQRLQLSGGVICRLAWKGAKIGAKGLYELNRSIHSPAIRKGGLNIVRHWLENRRGSLTALAIDFPALLSFLEIRPVPSSKNAVASQNAMHYVYNTIAPGAVSVRLLWIRGILRSYPSSLSRRDLSVTTTTSLTVVPNGNHRDFCGMRFVAENTDRGSAQGEMPPCQ